MIRIYGDRISGNCLKVKWTAERLGLAFEWIETSVLTGDTRTPEFLAVNPAGQAPVVVFDDGRALAQSNAIILHLAEGSTLIPAGAYDRAKMLEWLFWEQYSHEPYIAVARFRLVYQGLAKADIDPNLYLRGETALARMQLALTASPYLAGSALSLADVALVAYTRMADAGGFALAAYPAVSAWVVRIEAELQIKEPR